ncbi:MAG: cupin domain-containing protein [Candidatus Omnitrophota bacterium]
MFARKLNSCAEFMSGDGCVLRELFHPSKDGLKLRYSLAHATVRPGARTSPHRLRTSEVYYILEGKGVMTIDGKSGRVGPGTAVYIPPESVQFIKNSGIKPLVFLCIVDPAWRREDEEILGT